MHTTVFLFWLILFDLIAWFFIGLVFANRWKERWIYPIGMLISTFIIVKRAAVAITVAPFLFLIVILVMLLTPLAALIGYFLEKKNMRNLLGN